MRILRLLAWALVFAFAPRANADVIPASGGCSCMRRYHRALPPPRPEPLPAPPAAPDMAQAERESWRSRGRGMIALSTVSAIGVLALRRRRDRS